jgi:hypothetical protein
MSIGCFTRMTTHTQQQKPHWKKLNNFTWFLLETRQRFKVGSVKVICSILQYAFPKSLRAPTNATGIFSLGWNKLCTHHLKIPKVPHMNCHTTTLEIIDTIILSLVLVLIEKHTIPLDLSLILNAIEVQLSRCFGSSNPNEVLFLLRKNPNPTHTSSLQNV